MNIASGGLPAPETTAGSVPHRLAGYRGHGSTPWPLLSIYLSCIGITYLPLLITAALSGLPLWEPRELLRLPFLRDWGVAFAFLVSLPTLVILYVSDEQVLNEALRRVRMDEVIDLPPAAARRVIDKWTTRFRNANIAAQVAAVLVGIMAGLLTGRIYLRPEVGFWIVDAGGRLLLVGYVYVYCISLLYATIILYVIRNIVMTRFLHELVAPATIHLLPFHPDKCGGLRPVGQLGLRNQYTLTILGVNIVILISIAALTLRGVTELNELLLIATIIYVGLGPVVFMGPLLPFRAGMVRDKEQWSYEIAGILRNHFGQLRTGIVNGTITEADEKTIDRLRKLTAVVDELPIWPFDAGTVRRFATAYLVPLVIPLLAKVIELLLQ